MSDLWAQRRYGHGVARVRLSPEPRPLSDRSGGREGLLSMGTLLLGCLLLLGVLTSSSTEDDMLRIVAFEPPTLPEPEPELESAPPKVAQVAKPEPAPSAPKVALPAPPAKVDVAQLAAPPAPAPRPEPPRARRRARPAPKAEPAAPQVRIDALKVAGATPPASLRRSRVAVGPEVGAVRLRVQLDPLAAPERTPNAPRAPARSPARAPTRATQARATRRVRPDTVAVPAAPDASSEPVARSGRAAPPGPRRSTPTARRRPSVALVAAATVSAPTAGPHASASGRVARPPEKPAVETLSTASDRPLRGVPLGSLASCVSDREEDRLKRKMLGAVGERTECTSAAGRYRFLQTRNLNSFLMWIERTQQREAANRCTELQLALRCLADPNGGTR